MENIATEKDQEECAKAMFKAAFDSISLIKPLSEVQDMKNIAKQVVAAMCAAEGVKSKYEKSIALVGEGYVHININACDVVSSAFLCVMDDVDYSDDLAPFSERGWYLLSFLQGMAAAKFITDAESILDDSESSFQYAGNCSKLL